MIRNLLTIALLGAGCCLHAEEKAAKTASPARPCVYILTGQSNSLGAVKGSPATSAQLEQYASAAQLWNGNMNRDTGECFEKNQQWRTVAPQLPNYNGSLCMGPEYGFSSMMQRLNPRETPYIIKASLDGGGNHYWQPGGNAYKTLLQVVKHATKKLPSSSAKVTALLYLQGESDAGDEVSLAAQRFTELAKNLKKDLKKAGVTQASSLKFYVIGEPANWHGQDKTVNGKTTATELRKLAESRPDIGWVHTRDLDKITQGDSMGVHYDGKSQITIGARFACSLLSLQGKIPAGMRSDTQAPLNKPEAWWGGKLPTQETIAVWNVSAANTEETLEAPLKMKGLKIEDPFASTIAIKAGKGKALLQIGEEGIELQGSGLRMEGGVLDLAPKGKIFGTSTASLSQTTLRLRLAPEELEPTGDGSYSTKKLSALESVSGAVIVLLAPSVKTPCDILFLREDGSPVDFTQAKLNHSRYKQNAGEPGHITLGQ